MALKSAPIAGYPPAFDLKTATVRPGRLTQDVDVVDVLHLAMAPPVAQLTLHPRDELSAPHSHTLGS